jgi:Ni/Fe-hydrogenase subunit HybB-like protein
MSRAAGHSRDVDQATTEAIVSIPLDFPDPRAWWVLFGFSLILLLVLGISVGVLLWYGVGVFGNNIPVSWGFPIVNYIWFLGIGHAGTLISALLLLTGTTRRNALNRFAETMTLCAVICAGLYPILHLGRPWLFYWMAPYPNTMSIWPQFKSPLSWDFFAVLAYLIVSAAFWYIGTIPDLAALRDRATTRRAQVFYGLLALGWRGSAMHWARWRQAYRLTAAIAVPLVFAVTASYSLLLAGGPIPGWASTVFPPYFLAGAVFSGFAVVAMIAASLRHALQLGEFLTDRHLDLVGKLLLATGLMTAYGYAADAFTALYAGGYEYGTLIDRLIGAYAWTYWGALILNFLPLQLLWFRAVRVNAWLLAAIGLSVTIGMWLERYMLLASALYRDYLVSSWHIFVPSLWDWLLFAGMIGLFLAPFLLFVRLLPVISVFEVKEAAFEAREAAHA